MSARDIAIWAFGVAVGVVLMLVVGSGTPSSPTLPADDVPVDGASAVEQPVTLEGRHREPDLDAPLDVGVATAEPARSGSAAAASDVATAIQVVFPDATDQQRHIAVVYALAAGEPGSDAEADVPHAREDEAFLIPLVRGGTYDVGVRMRSGFRLERNVRVETGSTVTLESTMPDEGNVDVVFPNGALDPNHEVRITLGLQGGDRRWFPGRGQRMSWTWVLPVRGSGGATEWPIPVPLGEDIHVSAGAQVWTGDNKLVPNHDLCVTALPQRVRSGDVVRCLVERGVFVNVAFHARPVRNDNLSLRLSLVQEDGTGRLEFDSWVATRPPGAPQRTSLTRIVPPGDFTLRWTGKGIRPGAVRAEGLVPGEDVGLNAVVEPVTDWDAVIAANREGEPTPDEVQPIRFEGLTKEDGEDYEILVLGRFPDDHLTAPGAQSFTLSVEDDAIGAPWSDALEIGAVCGPFKVADAVPVSPGRETRLRFEEGGLVVVLVDRVIPENLGALYISRPDGLPIPAFHAEDGAENGPGWAEGRLASYTPQMIGPFPPGTLTLRVHIGRTRLRDLTVVVRPGRITPALVRR